jgi:hypothetical protein
MTEEPTPDPEPSEQEITLAAALAKAQLTYTDHVRREESQQDGTVLARWRRVERPLRLTDVLAHTITDTTVTLVTADGQKVVVEL